MHLYIYTYIFQKMPASVATSQRAALPQMSIFCDKSTGDSGRPQCQRQSISHVIVPSHYFLKNVILVIVIIHPQAPLCILLQGHLAHKKQLLPQGPP